DPRSGLIWLADGVLACLPIRSQRPRPAAFLIAPTREHYIIEKRLMLPVADNVGTGEELSSNCGTQGSAPPRRTDPTVNDGAGDTVSSPSHGPYREGWRRRSSRLVDGERTVEGFRGRNGVGHGKRNGVVTEQVK